VDAAGNRDENGSKLAHPSDRARPPRWGRLALGGLLLLVVSGAAGAAPTRNVLLLQSTQRGAEPFESVTTGFRAALAAGSPVPVEIHELSLATALYPDGHSEEPFVRYLESFAAQRPFDLIVAIGGTATRFAQQHRERVFPSTPLLIAGTDRRLVAPQAPAAGDVAVSVQMDLEGAFANIFRLLPDTTEIVVIVGRTPLEQFWSAELTREFQPFAGRARLTVWDELPFAEILRRAAALPPRTAILYTVFMGARGVSPTWRTRRSTRSTRRRRRRSSASSTPSSAAGSSGGR
jgi:hypothetical protein